MWIANQLLWQKSLPYLWHCYGYQTMSMLFWNARDNLSPSPGLVKGRAHLRDSIGESFIKDVKVKGPQCSHATKWHQLLSTFSQTSPSSWFQNSTLWSVCATLSKGKQLHVYLSICFMPLAHLQTGKINHCNLYKGKRKIFSYADFCNKRIKRANHFLCRMRSSSAAIWNSIPPSSLLIHIQTMRGHVMITIQEATIFGTNKRLLPSQVPRR